jgi:hypothetical protein
MKPEFRIANYGDRRVKWQLEAARHNEQKRLDQAIEKLWRARVKENELRRLAAKVEAA